MNTPNETYYHHDDASGNETTFRVEFFFTPGDPGRLTGPPEHCHPPEPAEIEITGVYLHSTSTEESRGQPRFRGNYCTAPIRMLDIISKQLVEQYPQYKTEHAYAIALHLLNSGGFIGPEQFHPPTDSIDLLSEETLEKMEAACWEEMENQEPDYPDDDPRY